MRIGKNQTIYNSQSLCCYVKGNESTAVVEDSDNVVKGDDVQSNDSTLKESQSWNENMNIEGKLTESRCIEILTEAAKSKMLKAYYLVTNKGLQTYGTRF